MYVHLLLEQEWVEFFIIIVVIVIIISFIAYDSPQKSWNVFFKDDR